MPLIGEFSTPRTPCLPNRLESLVSIRSPPSSPTSVQYPVLCEHYILPFPSISPSSDATGALFRVPSVRDLKDMGCSHSIFNAMRCLSGFGRTSLGLLVLVCLAPFLSSPKSQSDAGNECIVWRMGRVVIWRSTSSLSLFSLPLPFPHLLLLDALPPSDVCVSCLRYRRWKRGNLGFLISCARGWGFPFCLHRYTSVFVVNGFVLILVSSSLLLHVPIDVCHEESRCDIQKEILCLFQVRNWVQISSAFVQNFSKTGFQRVCLPA